MAVPTTTTKPSAPSRPTPKRSATLKATVLDALKIKPYDLGALYASWANAPVFMGKPKDDPVAWLNAIKAGCMERNVPRDYWHRVGRHFMGPKPRARLDDLGRVMEEMTGGRVAWDWKKFKIAVQNIGWRSEGPKSKTMSPPVGERPMPKKQGSWWIIGRQSSDSDKEKEKDDTSGGKVVVSKNVTAAPEKIKASQQGPTSTAIVPAGEPLSIAPGWLVNACAAMEFITVEHPKVMSAMSAVLITVGSIPAIPAISAGAGGVLLASHAVQAIGAVAIGVGQALKSISDHQANRATIEQIEAVPAVPAKK